uniref:Alpha-L-rhamnosidase-like protein n=1 Tax=Philodina roseola TaxID=96448 RepID=B3G4P2_PHIRO|nr:alpha-L-rhamnosidase-like protein [Philodina roseola]
MSSKNEIYPIFLLLVLSCIHAIPSSMSNVPVIYIPKLLNYTSDILTNNGTFPIHLTFSQNVTSYVILDYGENVGGFPFFDIDRVVGNSTTLRVSYSETLTNVIDGDMQFTPLIHSFDPYRVKVYTITNPGYIESPMVQGAQRYQRLALISEGSIHITKMGIKSTHHAKNIALAPGFFSCSSSAYTDMWRIGVRTLQINMIPPRIMPPGFIATDQGFFLSRNQAGVYLRGMQWVNYTVTFSMMIVSNGASFALRSNDYSEILITINSKEHDNPNMLTVQMREELPTTDASFYNTSLPLNISLLQWYDIKAIVNGLKIIVSINGINVSTIPIPESTNPYIPSMTPGGIAFSTSDNQETFFRDLKVVDLSTSNFEAILYQDSLSSKQAAADFGVGTNELPIILDGAKRDRNIWSGDLLVAGPVLYYSFYEPEYAAGSLAMLNSYQLKNGPVSSRINVGFPFQRGDPSDEFVSPIFYSYTYFLTNLISVAEYHLYTGDTQFVYDQWPRMYLLMNFFSTLIDTNNLIVSSYFVWGYDYNPSYGVYSGHFTKLNILYAMALDSAASMAEVINNMTLVRQYRQQAVMLRAAINTHLYNATEKYYKISDQQTVGIAQDTNSLAILSGIASELNPNTPQQLLEMMKEKLRVSSSNGTGYLSTTLDGIPMGASTIVSPFISFFHAAAAFEQDRSDLAFDVLGSVWSPMVQQGPYFTGTFWESERPNGYPSASTSMAHAWSAGITALLSKYVLGIRPTAPGYSSWSIRPQPGNLTWAVGRVGTPYGILTVKWNNSDTEFKISVTVPTSTTGIVYALEKGNCITINNKSFNTESYNKTLYGVSQITRNGSHWDIHIVSPGSYSIITNAVCNAALIFFVHSPKLMYFLLCFFVLLFQISA